MDGIVKEDAKRKYRSGWHSTKLHLALIGMAMLTVVFLFVVITTGSAAGFGEYTIGMVTFAAGYSGSRVAESFAQRPPPKPAGASSSSDDGAGGP